MKAPTAWSSGPCGDKRRRTWDSPPIGSSTAPSDRRAGCARRACAYLYRALSILSRGDEGNLTIADKCDIPPWRIRHVASVRGKCRLLRVAARTQVGLSPIYGSDLTKSSSSFETTSPYDRSSTWTSRGALLDRLRTDSLPALCCVSIPHFVS